MGYILIDNKQLEDKVEKLEMQKCFDEAALLRELLNSPNVEGEDLAVDFLQWVEKNCKVSIVNYPKYWCDFAKQGVFSRTQLFQIYVSRRAEI